eukprot:Opistho-2@25725
MTESKMPQANTTNMFLTRALQKILGEKETKRAQHLNLREACEHALADIKHDIEANEGKGQTESSAINYSNADKYFRPFELACQSKNPRIICTSLDCLQKLIAYGHLRGSTYDEADPSKRLLDFVIDTICNCFVGDQTDEGVQLQIIKALLTAVTSSACEVHEGALLKVVRTCYNIYLASRNLVNQTTAKATLTQMLNVIFQRMENQAAQKTDDAQASSQAAVDVPPVAAPSTNGDAASHDTDADADSRTDVQTEGDEDANSVEVMHDALSEQPAAGDAETPKETPPVDASEAGKYGFCIVCAKPANHYCAQTKQPVCGIECKRKYIEQVESQAPAPTTDADEGTAPEETTAQPPAQAPAAPAPVAAPAPTPTPTPTPAPVASLSSQSSRDADNGFADNLSKSYSDLGLNKDDLGNVGHFPHILQKDAFLVFRSLCRLSMRAITDAAQQDSKSHELRSKVLSLELLLSILQNSGPVFQTSDTFVNAIKQYLCLSLSKNGVSPIPGVFELSLAIFLTLISLYKGYLKTQIEVFFKDIFLNILETASSSFQHKWMVMQALSKVCADPQTVVDLFINYDCDLDMENIFERLVNDLSRIAQGRQSTELGGTPAQEQSMKTKGLECLVHILRSMVVWSNQMQAAERPELSTMLAQNAAEEPALDADAEGAAVANASAMATPTKTDLPEQLEELKQKKEILVRGFVRFNQKASKGIKYLQENGVLGTRPEDVAEFLHANDRLSKGQIGEFLGEGDKYTIDVMYAYVDLLHFAGLSLVEALRRFLEGFRLPGEAQKIDRLMEKFAQRYIANNPGNGIFANADTAYVLAYSIIMLTTDLHNPQVKKKMTKGEFVRNNRGINDSKDLPLEYLESIYDEIANRGIQMRGEKTMYKPTIAELANEKQRKEIYSKEMEVMLETAQAQLKDGSRATTFTTATRIEHIRPMFKVAWTPTLAAFSVTLKNTEDPPVVTLCLDGFKCAIRVSAIFYMELERDAYVQSLAKFTRLSSSGGPADMKPKNIETIKCLISIAHTEGNYLQRSWHHVLKCISQLEMAQLIGTGAKGNSALMQPDGRGGAGPNASGAGVSSSSMGGGRKGGVGSVSSERSVRPSVSSGMTVGERSTRRLSGNSETSVRGANGERLQSLQDTMGETSSQSIMVAVDRIFTGSVALRGDPIEEFVRWLCAVSLDELQSPQHPRMFCLQKIVEICYYNMGRIRLEWSRIWAIIGEYFNKVGCLPNLDVAMFAIDSLRQLSMKFLEKQELPSYHFQKDFLKPFEYIMNHNKSASIRDMVVRCLAQMVQSKAKNIVSGWKNIFFVFSLAAGDGEEGIVQLAFETSGSILDQHFELVPDSFMDAMNCLTEFACNPFFQDTAIEAVRLINEAASRVAGRPRLFYAKDGDGSDEEDRLWVRGWFPIVFGLSRVVSRCKLDIRTRALTVMFDCLKLYGASFRSQWWRDLFLIIFRIFDDLKLPEQQNEKTEWMNTTCNNALYAIVDVFTMYYETLQPILLSDVFDRLLWSVQQDNEQLARSGVHCLQILVLGNGTKFTTEVWDMSVQYVRKLFDKTVPHGLMTYGQHGANGHDDDHAPRGRKDNTADFHSIIIKCVVQLELIQAVQHMVLGAPDAEGVEGETPGVPAASNALLPSREGMYGLLSDGHVLLFLDCLRDAHDFARAFNANLELRTSLWKAGFMKQMPNLLKQETTSLVCAFRILFRVYDDDRRKGMWSEVERRIFEVSDKVFSYFSTLQSDKQREIWTPLLTLLLKETLKLPEDRFSRHIGAIYAYLCDILVFELRPEVRAALRDVFKRVGSQYNVVGPVS